MTVTVTIEDTGDTRYTCVPPVTAIASGCEADRLGLQAHGLRIDAVRARMDARFARMDTRFDRLDERMDRMDATLTEHGEMLAKILAWVEEQPKAPTKAAEK